MTRLRNPFRILNPFRRRVLSPGEIPSLKVTDDPGQTVVPPEPEKKRLSMLASDLFSLIPWLRSGSDLGGEEVRKRATDRLERFQKDARDAGYGKAETEDSLLALVALLDEAILTSEWSGKGSWRVRTLAQEHFNINIAGEEFFTRMERLRQHPKENRDVLEVYFKCLTLGFEGRYKLFGREKLELMISEFAKELTNGAHWNVRELSPQWQRPDDFPEMVGEGMPVWASVLLSVPIASLLIFIFAMLARSVANRAAIDLGSLASGL
jgi:type VI secretion system protein ImpK